MGTVCGSLQCTKLRCVWLRHCTVTPSSTAPRRPVTTAFLTLGFQLWDSKSYAIELRYKSYAIRATQQKQFIEEQALLCGQFLHRQADALPFP